MAADLGAWGVFEDESGQGLRPPKGRTWGRRGHTPMVRVTAANSPRLSLAALVATKPGQRPPLIYRTHRGRRGGGRRKGFTEADYAAAGSQYTSLAFTEALLEAGIAGSIGSVGDALYNALMESTIGLYKTELIDRQRSWTGRNVVERETAAWVHWFNTERLHSALNYRPPVEFEDHYRDTTATADLAVA